MKSIQFFVVVCALGFSTFSMAADQITIASVQYPVEGGRSKEQLFTKIESFVKEAAQKKSDLVLFPEWVTLDTWPMKKAVQDKEVVASVANDLTDSYWSELKILSKKYHLVIAGGSTAKKTGDKIYNSAVIVFPDGRLIEHRKVYLTQWEKDNGLSPGKEATVFDTQWGRMALLICYDIEFPDLSVDLAKSSLDVILVPSMTESTEGANRVRFTAQARAVEHAAFVVTSPTVGTVSKDWKLFGTASFMAPQLPGLPSQLREGTRSKGGVWTRKFDLKTLRKIKETTSWLPARQIQPKRSSL